MKLELTGDEWLLIAETLIAQGRDGRSPNWSPDLLDLAAMILRGLRLDATAGAIEAESDRIAATLTSKGSPT